MSSILKEELELEELRRRAGLPARTDYIRSLREAEDDEPLSLSVQVTMAYERYRANPTPETGAEVKRLMKLRDQEQARIEAEYAAKRQAAAPQADTYKGEHEAPDHENGAPLWNLVGMYPDDFYGPNGLDYYGSEDPGAYHAATALKGRPNAQVVIYRAVPKSAGKVRIGPGDWVTLNRRYAVEHGRDNLRNDYRIISKSVFARDLFTDGNSLAEWGYDPQPRVKLEKPAP